MFKWTQVSSSQEQNSTTIRCNTSGIVKNSDMYLFCGKGVGLLESSWKFDKTKKSWELLETDGPSPPPRDGLTATIIESNSVPYDVIIFGGQSTPPEPKEHHVPSRIKTIRERTLLGDMWGFECDNNKWTRMDPTVAPSPRRGHSVVLWKRVGFGADMFQDDNHNNNSSHDGPENHDSSNNKSRKKSKVTNIDKTMKLVIYGGSGIDPIRGEETILNDVWEYSFDKNRWFQSPIQGGMKPPGSYNHACTLVRSDMIVSGGIGQPKFNEGPLDNKKKNVLRELPVESGIWVLDLNNMSWSHVELTDQYGMSFQFCMHSHSMIAHPTRNDTILLFGGRETVSPFTASKRKDIMNVTSDMNNNFKKGRKKQSLMKNDISAINSWGLYAINLRKMSIIECQPEGDVPENRFGHIACAIPTSQDRKEKQKNKNNRWSSPTKNNDNTPILLLYGGSRTGVGGYCSNEVFELKEVPSNKNQLPNTLNSRSGSPASAMSLAEKSGASRASRQSRASRAASANAELQAESFLNSKQSFSPSDKKQTGFEESFDASSWGFAQGNERSGGDIPGMDGSPVSPLSIEGDRRLRTTGNMDMGGRKQKQETLWIKSLKPILGPTSYDKPASPSNFKELKLALSYSRSDKMLKTDLEEQSLGRRPQTTGMMGMGMSASLGNSQELASLGQGLGRNNSGVRSKSANHTMKSTRKGQNNTKKNTKDPKIFYTPKQRLKMLNERAKELAPLMKGLNLAEARRTYSAKHPIRYDWDD